MIREAGEGPAPHSGFLPGLTIGRALPPYSRSAAFALPRLNALSPLSPIIAGGRIIPDDMTIPSPAVLALSGWGFRSHEQHFWRSQRNV
jgi:hypothetical protein